MFQLLWRKKHVLGRSNINIVVCIRSRKLNVVHFRLRFFFKEFHYGNELFICSDTNNYLKVLSYRNNMIYTTITRTCTSWLLSNILPLHHIQKQHIVCKSPPSSYMYMYGSYLQSYFECHETVWRK